MTKKGAYSSYHDENGNDIHWPDPIRLPEAVADIVLVRPRREGYIYVLDGQMMDDGSTRPTREPRVAPLMAAFLRYGAERRFTLREAIDATYDAGRHSNSWSYKFHRREGATKEQLKEHIVRDHWVLANTSDTFSCAARCHLKIVLRDATITVTKPERGVYMFHVKDPTPTAYSDHPVMSLEDFLMKYRIKFAKEGIR